MKLSQYAKKAGVSYRTAFRWWKAGQLKGYQTASKTIIITEEDQQPPVVGPPMVAIYARVSSAEHRANLERQAERLLDYCAAKGYQVHKVVKDIASGRFGFRYVQTLLRGQGRAIEVVNLAENNREDLLADLASIVYSFCARLYGPRRAKRKTEAIVEQLKQEAEGAE